MWIHHPHPHPQPHPKQAGAEGGRDGALFGLRVSHVALAMHEGRSAVGVERPLVGLVDVALHDALLPLAAKVQGAALPAAYCSLPATHYSLPTAH